MTGGNGARANIAGAGDEITIDSTRGHPNGRRSDSSRPKLPDEAPLASACVPRQVRIRDRLTGRALRVPIEALLASSAIL